MRGSGRARVRCGVEGREDAGMGEGSGPGGRGNGYQKRKVKLGEPRKMGRKLLILKIYPQGADEYQVEEGTGNAGQK